MMVQSRGNRYFHLSQEEREEIYGFFREGLSFREIARRTARSHSTIIREIQRNSADLGRERTKYSPMKAQKKYEHRRYTANRKQIILWRDHKQRHYLISLLKKKGHHQGPDELLGRLRDIHGRKVVSTSTFYRFIREEMPELQRCLRYKASGYKPGGKEKRKRKYTDVPNIADRPEKANNREEIGHREGDTIVSNRTVKGGAVTLVERKSRYVLIKKIGNHKAESVRHTIEAMLSGEEVKTTTRDNGSEFAEIGQLSVGQAYRCNAYASYERPTNERTNGMIRWFIPKGANVNDRSDDEIQQIQNDLNHKPRKILGYRTPYEVYHNVTLTYTT